MSKTVFVEENTLKWREEGDVTGCRDCPELVELNLAGVSGAKLYGCKLNNELYGTTSENSNIAETVHVDCPLLPNGVTQIRMTNGYLIPNGSKFVKYQESSGDYLLENHAEDGQIYLIYRNSSVRKICLALEYCLTLEKRGDRIIDLKNLT